MRLKTEALVKNIIDQIRTRDEWHLALSDLLEYTDLSLATLYQRLYSLREKICLDAALEGFSLANTGDFLTFLEACAGKSLEEIFSREGLFIPFSRGIELVAFLFQFFYDRMLLHQLQEEAFLGMLQHTGNFYRAVSIYSREYCPLFGLLDQAVFEFLEEQGLPEYAQPVYNWYSRSLLERNLLQPHRLFLKLNQRLELLARRLGYDPYPGGSSGGELPNSSDSAELQEARELFRLVGLPPSRSLIKSRYKELMKRYHPDLNPRGLEMSQRVNSAYALLLANVD